MWLFFNLNSLKYLIPCGGDDIDTVKGDLVLGFSKGQEFFSPLGQEKIETPNEGEIIYYDNKTLNVMCRKWNWRNSRFTMITEKSRRIIINLDGMKETSKEYIIKARDEMGELITNFCKGKIEKDYLDIKKKRNYYHLLINKQINSLNLTLLTLI